MPALQPFAKQLDQYVRGSAWIAAPFASSELLKRSPNGTNRTSTSCQASQRFPRALGRGSLCSNHFANQLPLPLADKFTEEELARFRDDKEFYDEFRHAQEAELNCLHHLTFHGECQPMPLLSSTLTFL